MSTFEQRSVSDTIRSLVLVKLRISWWDGRTSRDDLSRQTENDTGAERGTVGTTAIQLPDEWRKPITKAVSHLRSHWYLYTVPWEARSWRAVTAKGYQPLMDEIARLRENEFEPAAVNIYGSRYEEMKQASRARMNGLFVEEDFPTAEQLRRRFSVTTSMSAIADPTDIRLIGIADDVVLDIREQVEQQHRVKVAEIVDHILRELTSLLENASEKLSREKQKGVHYGKLSDMVTKVCGALRELDPTGDPDIALRIDRVRNIVSSWDPEKLRVSAGHRQRALKQTNDLMSQLGALAL